MGKSWGWSAAFVNAKHNLFTFGSVMVCEYAWHTNKPPYNLGAEWFTVNVQQTSCQPSSCIALGQVLEQVLGLPHLLWSRLVRLVHGSRIGHSNGGTGRRCHGNGRWRLLKNSRHNSSGRKKRDPKMQKEMSVLKYTNCTNGFVAWDDLSLWRVSPWSRLPTQHWPFFPKSQNKQTPSCLRLTKLGSKPFTSRSLYTTQLTDTVARHPAAFGEGLHGLIIVQGEVIMLGPVLREVVSSLVVLLRWFLFLT